VIGYSYLWAREHGQGAEEGNKDRPCAIVAARQIVEGREVVTVLAITHTPPSDPRDAVEIPAAVKQHLGLDNLRSWIVVTETNDLCGRGRTCDPYPACRRRASNTGCCRRVSSPMSGTEGRLKHEVQHRVILSVGVLYGQGIQAVIC
jgi:hypothetical protein